jgi:hypothetical protein
MAKKKPKPSYRATTLDDLLESGVQYRQPEPEAPAEPEKQPRSFGRVLADVGISGLKGAIGIPEAAVGLADIPTGGRVGKALESVGFRPKEAKAFLDDQYSDEQKQAFKAVSDAEGFGGKFVAALQNPSVVGHSIVESLPAMGAGGVVGRGVLAAAPRLGAAGAAAIGEGVVGGGQAAEQTRQQTADGYLTAPQAALATLSGAGTAAFGALGNKVAKSLGIHDVDTMLVGAVQNPATAKGVVRRVLEGAMSEGVLEELPQSIQEQVLQNAALGKPLDEGVDQAAVLGLLSGAAMGGGANVIAGARGAPPVPAQEPPDAAASPVVPALPAPTITVGPDGAAQTADQRQAQRDAAGNIIEVPGAAGQGRGSDPARLAPAVQVGPDGTAQTVEQRQAVRDAATAARDARRGLVERGPLSRAAAAVVGPVVDVEAKPAPGGAAELAGEPAAAVDQVPDEPASVTAEPLSDTLAQIAAVRDPSSAKDAALITPNSARDVDLSGLQAVETHRGLFVTSNPAKAEAMRALADTVSDDDMGAALGYTAPKVASDGAVVQALDAAGNVVHEQATSAQGLPEAEARAREMAPAGGTVQQTDADAVQARRAAGDGVFTTYEAAEQFRKDQKARGATITALPVETEGGFRLAAQGTPDYAKGEALRGERRAAKARADAGVQDGDITNSKGMPFTIRLPAINAAKKAGAGHEVVPVKGGFVVRRAAPKIEEAALQEPAADVPSAAETLPTEDLAGRKLRGEWTAFAKDSGTKGVPRSEMPQIRAEHRGAMVNFLNARGIAHEQQEVLASDLKPTQVEFSPARVARAKAFEGGDRSILVSSDGHVLDGHHQWMAKLGAGEPVKVIRLDAPIERLLSEVKEFPSAEAGEGAAKAPAPAPPTTNGRGGGKFRVMERRAVQRGAVGTGEQSTFEWVHDPKMGEFDSPVQAKAFVVRRMDPALKNADDEQAAKHFGRGTIQGFKIERAPAPKRETKAQAAAREAEEARARYFTPGNIVRGYGGRFDRIISYKPAGADGRWSVTVKAVQQIGPATFEDVPGERERTHSTQPEPRLLKNGPHPDSKPVPAVPQAPAANGDQFPGFFHGTAMPMESFEVGRGGGAGYHHQGPAVYLTDDRNGLARFFAGAAAVKVSRRDKTLTEAQQDAITDSGGVVLNVDIAPEAKILDMRGAGVPADVKALFDRSVGDRAVGAQLRSKVMELGYDGIAFLEPNRPDGWETKPDAVTLAIYRPDKALIKGSMSSEEAKAVENVNGADSSVGPVKSDVRGRRGEGANRGTAVASVRRTVEQLSRAWRNAPEIVVARDMADSLVPEAVRGYNEGQLAQGAEGLPEGFFYDGKVYLLADQLDHPRDVARVLFHEALGHFGLRGTFGDGLVPILQQIAHLRRAQVAAKAREYGLDMTDPVQRLVAAEEVLAEMAQTKPEIGFVRRAIAAIRSWLRSTFSALRDIKLIDDEILHNYLLPARGFVQRGRAAKAGQLQPEAAFSRRVPAADAQQALNDPRDFRARATQAVADMMGAPGTVSWWHKSVGSMHDLAKRSPKFAKVFDAVQDFLGDVSAYATEAADKAPTLLPKLETWRDIARSPISAEDTKAIAAPIFEGTLTWGRDAEGKLAKMDDLERRYANAPAELKAKVLQPGVVFTDAELRDHFKATPAQVGLYREFRAAVDQSLNRMAISEMLRFGGADVEAMRSMAMDAGTAAGAATVLRDYLLTLANEQPARADVLKDTAEKVTEKAATVQRLVEHGYAPLSRFGHYTVDVVDEKGDRAYFGMFESRGEANRMARRMRENYPRGAITQGTVSQQAYKLFSGITPETLELFGEMVGLEAQGDEAQHQLFQQYLKLAKANRSAMKRLIERKGIAGFNEDAGRVLAGFVYSNARLTSTNLHTGEISRATADIAKEEGELKDVAVKLADYVRNPQEEAQALRGMLFAQYLGGSLASAMVNMTQPIAVTMPYLSQWGGAIKAAGRMRGALADVLKKSTGDAKLDAALKKAEEEGIVAPQEVHQLMAQAQGRGSLRAGDGTTAGNLAAKAANLTSKVALAWGKPFAAAEQFNRRVTFIAAYRTAVAEGIADPARFAEEAIRDTQFVYNKGNKPQWARGAIGGTLFTFKQYSISYMELLHRMATRGGSEGRKAALFSLAMLFLMGGAGGMPFMGDAEDAIDGIMQRLGYSFSTKQARRQFFIDVLGKQGAAFVERGASGLPGVPIDVAGRLGMGNLIPGTGLLTKKQDYGRDVAEILGPAGDLAQRAFQGAGQVLSGKPLEGVETAAPTAVRNVSKAFDMFQTGMYRDQRGRKVIDVDGYDALAKAIGFQPSGVAQVQEANAAQQDLIGQNKLMKTELADAMAQAVFERDPEKQQMVRERMLSWNKNNPQSPVTVDMAGVRRRVMAMRQSKAVRIEKSAPKAIRGEVRRALEEGAV